MLGVQGRPGRKSIGLTAFFFTTALFYLYATTDLLRQDYFPSNPFRLDALNPRDLPCRNFPGANDTVVILKTGSTELQDKLPVHLNTTLRCYPNHLIVSDYAETYHGESIIDALEDVDASYKDSHADFALYRKLQTSGGRAALDPSELSGPASGPQDIRIENLDGLTNSTKSGKPTNPGWRLDKWKFLPMLNQTLNRFPDKKWYVFVETDTYVFWSTLLAYLAALDSEKKYYIGAQAQILDVVFAHGGSGFALSRPALEGAVRYYVERKEELERSTAIQWAGDCILGSVMRDSGTPLTWAWPIWQGGGVGEAVWGELEFGKRLWCFPAVSWHHLGPDAVQDMWEFEQWRSRGRKASSSLLPPIIRHREIFKEYVLPRTAAESRRDWDNHSGDDRGLVGSLEGCRGVCEADEACLQFMLDSGGRCFTTALPSLGKASPLSGSVSGWVQERMVRYYEEAEVCGDEGWIL